MKKLTILPLFLILILNLGLSACFHDESDAAKLRDADLEFKNPIKLSKTKFVDELNDIEEFIHESDDFEFFSASDAEEDEFTKCLLDNFGNNSFSAGSSQGARLDADLGGVQNCFGQTFSDVNLENIALSVLIDNLILVDASGNQVDLSNKAFKATSDLFVKEGNLRMWFAIKASAATSQGNQSIEVTAVYSQNHVSSINSPCKFESPLNDCRITSIFNIQTSSGSENGQEGYILDANNLFFGDSDSYFYNGNIKFTINNWNGKMQYGSTGTDKPTYDATDGNESATGTYSSGNFAKPTPRIAGNRNIADQVSGTLSEKIGSIIAQNIRSAVATRN